MFLIKSRFCPRVRGTAVLWCPLRVIANVYGAANNEEEGEKRIALFEKTPCSIVNAAYIVN